MRAPRREHVDPLLGVPVVGQDLAGVPVVQGLVVVPLADDRHVGVQVQHVLVEQVVLVTAAILGQCLGDLGDLLGHHVLPDGAVGNLQLGLDRAVGVDVVAGVQEEVGPGLVHRLVRDHAADLGVDAVSLAGGVPGPDEAHRAVAARSTEGAFGGLADPAGRVLEADPVVVALAGPESLQRQLGGEVLVGRGDRAPQPHCLVEPAMAGQVDDEAGAAIRPGPDDGRVRGDVAAGDPGRQGGPGTADEVGGSGGGCGRYGDGGARGGGGGQQLAAAQVHEAEGALPG